MNPRNASLKAIGLFAVTLIAGAVLMSCSQVASLEAKYPIVKEAVTAIGPIAEQAATTAVNSEIVSLNKKLGGNAASAAAVQNLGQLAANAVYGNMGTPGVTAESLAQDVINATGAQLPSTAEAIGAAYLQSKSGQTDTTLGAIATIVSSLSGAVPGGTVKAAVVKAQSANPSSMFRYEEIRLRGDSYQTAQLECPTDQVQPLFVF